MSFGKVHIKKYFYNVHVFILLFVVPSQLIFLNVFI